VPHRKTFTCVILTILCCFFQYNIFATDAEAFESYNDAEKEYNDGDYRDAAKGFGAAELFADNYDLKVKALKAKAISYKKADMKYQEFLALKRLTEEYPDQVFFRNAIRREYELGNDFYEGYREQPWSWVPWLVDEDKCIEIYEAIYRQSPFADFIPEMMLKMGTRYIVTKKSDKALETYKKMIIQYKTSPLTRLAYLDSACVYLQLASSGDGDGSKLREARVNLKEYVDKYPNSPEINWAKNMLKMTYELESKRLYALAHYYYKKGNDSASKRYIQEILVNYPETETAAKADNLLNYIEMPLYPKERAPLPEDPTKYTVSSMTPTDERIMVIPENSGNKWLNPLKETGKAEDDLHIEKYANQL